jgi:hypothetical protein
LKDLQKYWVGLLMKPGTPKDVVLVDSMYDQLAKKIKLDNEILMWLGDYSASPSNASTGMIDGFIYQMTDETDYPDAANINYISAASGAHTSSTIIAHVNAMVAGRPSNILLRDDQIMFVSPETYELYTSALVALNLFHYDGAYAPTYSIYVPGKNVKVVSTIGLSGSNAMVLTYGENLIIGTDLANEEEKAIIMYSEITDSGFVNAQWKLGVAYGQGKDIVTNFAHA